MDRSAGTVSSLSGGMDRSGASLFGAMERYDPHDYGSHVSGDVTSLGDLTKDDIDSTHSTRTSTESGSDFNPAGKETKEVRQFRVVLFVVLFSLMVLASVGVYFYIKNDETSKFQVSLETLSTSLTSRAMDENSTMTTGTWPFVTLPNSARLLEPYLVANVASLVVMPIVGIRQRTAWEKYVRKNQNWVQDDLKQRSDMQAEQQAAQQERASLAGALLELNEEQEDEGQDLGHDQHDGFEISTSPDEEGGHHQHKRQLQYFTEDNSSNHDYQVSSYIKNYVGVDVSKGPWVVWWQYAPVIPNRWFLNFNRLAFEGFKEEVQAVLRKEAVISKAWTYEPGLDFQSTRDFTFLQELLTAGGNGRYQEGEPIGFIHYPVMNKFGRDGDTAAVLTATIYWKTYFTGVLPEHTKDIIAVVENSHGQAFSYLVQGEKAIFLGSGDLHNPKYDHLGMSADYSNFMTDSDSDYTGRRVDNEYISYKIHVYPTSDMENDYVSNAPVIWLSSVLAGFTVIIVFFVIYDRRVERRQRVVWTSAIRSNNVIVDMFPAHLHDRLMDEEETKLTSTKAGRSHNLKQFLNDGKDAHLHDRLRQSEPLADLYLDTTVLVADIVGFTAWSSVREPHLVFLLLERLYFSFDKIAKKRRVYKVETVGDSYVAVAGLPDPRKDHPIAIARFGKDIISKMRVLTKELEVELGPDTADLGLRIGLHSGPVTAGVLRGERARFQLFGDTMNMVSRIEKTGKEGRIHCSKETAALLMGLGKGGWLEKRQDFVDKGTRESYWVRVGGTRAGSVASVVSSQDDEELMATQRFGPWKPDLDDKTNRLIDWNVEMLLRLLKQIVARRALSGSTNASTRKKPKPILREDSLDDCDFLFAATPLEEVREIITLPAFSHTPQDQDIKIPTEVVKQLHHLVTKIACLYNDNPFHNFDHASHVVQSVIKLMSRIVATAELGDETLDGTDHAVARHDHTYGITSDPLIHFACAFSALIHDADHVGVSNAQLVKEEVPIAKRYSGRSVAEQNSLDLSWELLMNPAYTKLQSFIFQTHKELNRFRQLVVNSVMATDIVDADLKALRNGRWDKAFKLGDGADHVDANPRDATNRKATIVIEHIIQASDISHTMQHWNVYLKWNQNLFEELYVAYLNGRMEKDPGDFWYKGEFGFFDFYIIPLTKKLKDCGVFGVSSDEYLNYAQKNRENWEIHGEEMVERFKKEAREKYGVKKGTLDSLQGEVHLESETETFENETDC